MGADTNTQTQMGRSADDPSELVESDTNAPNIVHGVGAGGVSMHIDMCVYVYVYMYGGYISNKTRGGGLGGRGNLGLKP